MTDRIEVNQVIHPGQEMTSPSGEYQLVFQHDSNFVLYRRNDDGSEAIWATDTWADGEATNKSVVLQADGNFVMYDAEGQPLWASSSNYETVNPYILVQDDGNVCLYDEGVEGCFWNTGTTQ